MAKGETLFSKVLRGFAPDEVIAYIDELNAAHRNAKSECDARINSLSEELESLKKEIEANGSLKSQLDEKDEVIKHKDEEIERLNNDAENQRLAIVDMGEKMSLLENKLSDAKNELNEAKTEIEAAAIKAAAMEKNSKEYEQMLADVESVLATARRKAQELLHEAEQRASEIVESAEKEAKAKSERIISEADEHLNDNMKKVKYLYRRQDELAEIFRDHKAKVDSFFATISDVSDKN